MIYHLECQFIKNRRKIVPKLPTYATKKDLLTLKKELIAMMKKGKAKEKKEEKKMPKKKGKC